MKNGVELGVVSFVFVLILCCLSPVGAQEGTVGRTLDERVEAFLDSMQGGWNDWNVPYSDGRILHDIILEHGYTQALEIGTSTGLSAIWIAWALTKTGGTLITIEIDEGRYNEALENFRKAGLTDYIDARLADAHQLVKELDGPFDFVFCDADKGWYTNYFKDVYPKLAEGGCYTAHNVYEWRKSGGAYEFYTYIKSLPDMETTLDNSGRGISISYKRPR